jgi:hypothetical protein
MVVARNLTAHARNGWADERTMAAVEEAVGRASRDMNERRTGQELTPAGDLKAEQQRIKQTIAAVLLKAGPADDEDMVMFARTAAGIISKHIVEHYTNGQESDRGGPRPVHARHDGAHATADKAGKSDSKKSDGGADAEEDCSQRTVPPTQEGGAALELGDESGPAEDVSPEGEETHAGEPKEPRAPPTPAAPTMVRASSRRTQTPNRLTYAEKHDAGQRTLSSVGITHGKGPLRENPKTQARTTTPKRTQKEKGEALVQTHAKITKKSDKEDESEVYEVDRIIARRWECKFDGTSEHHATTCRQASRCPANYVVQWKGYGVRGCTWVGDDAVAGCAAAIKEYNALRANGKTPAQASEGITAADKDAQERAQKAAGEAASAAENRGATSRAGRAPADAITVSSRSHSRSSTASGTTAGSRTRQPPSVSTEPPKAEPKPTSQTSTVDVIGTPSEASSGNGQYDEQINDSDGGGGTAGEQSDEDYDPKDNTTRSPWTKSRKRDEKSGEHSGRNATTASTATAPEPRFGGQTAEDEKVETQYQMTDVPGDGRCGWYALQLGIHGQTYTDAQQAADMQEAVGEVVEKEYDETKQRVKGCYVGGTVAEMGGVAAYVRQLKGQNPRWMTANDLELYLETVADPEAAHCRVVTVTPTGKAWAEIRQRREEGRTISKELTQRLEVSVGVYGNTTPKWMCVIVNANSHFQVLCKNNNPMGQQHRMPYSESGRKEAVRNATRLLRSMETGTLTKPGRVSHVTLKKSANKETSQAAGDKDPATNVQAQHKTSVENGTTKASSEQGPGIRNTEVGQKEVGKEETKTTAKMIRAANRNVPEWCGGNLPEQELCFKILFMDAGGDANPNANRAERRARYPARTNIISWEYVATRCAEVGMDVGALVRFWRPLGWKVLFQAKNEAMYKQAITMAPGVANRSKGTILIEADTPRTRTYPVGRVGSKRGTVGRTAKKMQRHEDRADESDDTTEPDRSESWEKVRGKQRRAEDNERRGTREHTRDRERRTEAGTRPQRNESARRGSRTRPKRHPHPRGEPEQTTSDSESQREESRPATAEDKPRTRRHTRDSANANATATSVKTQERERSKGVSNRSDTAAEDEVQFTPMDIAKAMAAMKAFSKALDDGLVGTAPGGPNINSQSQQPPATTTTTARN